MRKLVNATIGFFIGTMLSLGAAGALVTAFQLPMLHFSAVVGACVLGALLGAAAFSGKRGGALLLLLGALAGGYLWRQGDLWDQTRYLLELISQVYNQAYHWGYLVLLSGAPAGLDLPVAVLGAAMALLGSWTVCREQTGALALCASILTLTPCLVVTDTVPAPSYLYLLIFSNLLLLLTGHVRRENGYQGDRLILRILLPTAIALGALFFLLPQDGYVNRSAELRNRLFARFQTVSRQELPQLSESFLAPREPESLDLAALGPRQPQTAPVMTVTAQSGGTLYLRGRDYDIYDGRDWTTSDKRVDRLEYEGIDLGAVTVETQTPMAELYLPYYPRGGMSLIGGRYENTRLDRRYTLHRLGLPDGSDQLSAAPGAESAVGGTYLELPQAAREGALGVLGNLDLTGTAWDRAQAIGSYLRSLGIYDRSPGRMPSGEADFAMWFLEGGGRGYCVHFATTAVVLLRAAGIPARYVSGYMLPARAGETVTVTGENAHAWAEYYDPGLGTWRVLEATPADGLTETPDTQTPQQSLPPETTAPETEAPAPTTEAPAAETPPSQAPETAPPSQAPVSRRSSGIWKVLIAALLFMAAVEGQFRLRVFLRGRRARRGRPNARALARWREVEKLSRLLRQKPPKELVLLANKAKFSQHTLTSDELAVFDDWLRRGRDTLKKRPPLLRLLYRYLFAEPF